MATPTSIKFSALYLYPGITGESIRSLISEMQGRHSLNVFILTDDEKLHKGLIESFKEENEKMSELNNNNTWRSLIAKASIDFESMDLLERMLVEYEDAKQLLRNKGFGCSGMGLLDTVKEAVGEIKC